MTSKSCNEFQVIDATFTLNSFLKAYPLAVDKFLNLIPHLSFIYGYEEGDEKSCLKNEALIVFCWDIIERYSVLFSDDDLLIKLLENMVTNSLGGLKFIADCHFKYDLIKAFHIQDKSEEFGSLALMKLISLLEQERQPSIKEIHDSAISQVISIFPNLSLSFISEFLKECDDNVDLFICRYCDGDVPSHILALIEEKPNNNQEDELVKMKTLDIVAKMTLEEEEDVPFDYISHGLDKELTFLLFPIYTSSPNDFDSSLKGSRDIIGKFLARIKSQTPLDIEKVKGWYSMFRRLGEKQKLKIAEEISLNDRSRGSLLLSESTVRPTIKTHKTKRGRGRGDKTKMWD
jgi:hypothetical protein